MSQQESVINEHGKRQLGGTLTTPPPPPPPPPIVQTLPASTIQQSDTPLTHTDTYEYDALQQQSATVLAQYYQLNQQYQGGSVIQQGLEVMPAYQQLRRDNYHDTGAVREQKPHTSVQHTQQTIGPQIPRVGVEEQPIVGGKHRGGMGGRGGRGGASGGGNGMFGSGNSVGGRAPVNAAPQGPPGLFGPDDWACTSCGNVNWARRPKCNLCGAPKPGTVDQTRQGVGGGFKELDEKEIEEAKQRRKRFEEEDDDIYDDFGRVKKKHRTLSQSQAVRSNGSHKTNKDKKKKLSNEQ
eukprot:TRINITY_DN1479_c0_g1_i6.p1 TRINITY_DN1479_c0_g1~~TRINITY_DN1479_c0_g1_i6.p1  ORF type:complete len:295 (+),score=53.07 TRINITY_DN1479_c0_g1_i6:263-1147(+)